ncbi:MAG: alpha/beta hydrolase family protein [Candidatus Acidiferrales bacterium]
MNRPRGAAILALVMAAGFALMAPPARGAGRAECLSIHSKILGRAVGYCALLPPSYDAAKDARFPILYLLHGIGGNQQTILGGGGLNLVEDLWERHAIGDFLIVTPDGDSSFYINSRDGRVRYEDFLIREFFPYIERRYRVNGSRATRGISGISMGGYGALHLAFRHPELFGSVSAHSAALLLQLPRVSATGGAASAEMSLLGDVFGSPPDPAFWRRNDPLELARTAPLAGLKIYFDCGTEDEYGFYRGALKLDEILTGRKITHEFHLDPGGHDWTYFAEHLPESLEFHSRAFAAASARR